MKKSNDFDTLAISRKNSTADVLSDFNPACDDSTGSSHIKKNWIGVPPGLVWEKGGGGMVWFCLCEGCLDDWANVGSINVSFTYGGYGFSSIRI